MSTDLLASHPRYLAHARPAWDALPPGARGRILAPGDLAGQGLVLAASLVDAQDAARAGRRVALLAHGIGQAYDGRPLGWVDGMIAPAVYLAPGPYAATWARALWPGCRVEVVGPPGLDALFHGKRSNRGQPRAESGPGCRPVVGLGFRFLGGATSVPEATSALTHYLPGLRGLAARYELIGHGHPRAMGRLAGLYAAHGIEVVRDWAAVLARADVWCADSSSTLYEAAACGLPVVALDAPWYRREVHHGLRWWDSVPGERVDGPAALPDAIDRALAGVPDPGLSVGALAAAYGGHADGHAAERAAAILGAL